MFSHCASLHDGNCSAARIYFRRLYSPAVRFYETTCRYLLRNLRCRIPRRSLDRPRCISTIAIALKLNKLSVYVLLSVEQRVIKAAATWCAPRLYILIVTLSRFVINFERRLKRRRKHFQLNCTIRTLRAAELSASSANEGIVKYFKTIYAATRCTAEPDWVRRGAFFPQFSDRWRDISRRRSGKAGAIISIISLKNVFQQRRPQRVQFIYILEKATETVFEDSSHLYAEGKVNHNFQNYKKARAK